MPTKQPPKFIRVNGQVYRLADAERYTYRQYLETADTSPSGFSDYLNVAISLESTFRKVAETLQKGINTFKNLSGNPNDESFPSDADWFINMIKDAADAADRSEMAKLLADAMQHKS